MDRPNDSTTDALLRRAGHGDRSAINCLLGNHRDRLRRMVAVRMDGRLSARCDASDVVQEAMVEATRRFSEYLQQRDLPFYPWLRQIAWQRLVDQFRRHVRSRRRSIEREEPRAMALPDASSVLLADRLLANGTSPSRAARREERGRQIRGALAKLAPHDREVLVLRYLEQLSSREIAAVLGVTERTVRSRHRRALMRLGDLIGDDLLEGEG